MYELVTTPDRTGTESVKWDMPVKKYKKKDLLPLWIADMDFSVAPCITEALLDRIRHPVYGYTYPGENYKQAICDWFFSRHHVKLAADWILPCGNTVTAFTVALTAVTRPQDKCLTFSPVYDPLTDAVLHCGRTLVRLPFINKNHRYEVDFDVFEQKLMEGVRCLIMCNPHNPGGKVWTENELEKIAFLCEQYQVTILSDDVHCDWVFDPFTYRPVMVFPGARKRTILFTSPSKTFNLAGLVSCNLIIEDPALRTLVQDALSHMFIRGSNVFAYTAAQAAYKGGAAWLDQAKSYVLENADFVEKQLSIHAPGLHVFSHESSFLLWIDCKSVKKNDKEICRSLIQNYGITVNEGSTYGPEGEGYIRLNIACSQELLQTAVAALAAWYNDQI